MEMLIIAVIAIVAFAAVLIPLFRKGPRGSDAREFEGDAAPPAPAPRQGTKKSGRPPAAPTTSATPTAPPAAPTAPAAAPTAPPAAPTAPAAPVADPAQGEGVVPPMVSGPVAPVDATGAAQEPTGEAGVPPEAAEDELELEVQRYRAALRAGTICNKCGQANPADSAFCFDCGGALPRAEAREFE
jgi:hypothetical protein